MSVTARLSHDWGTRNRRTTQRCAGDVKSRVPTRKEHKMHINRRLHLHHGRETLVSGQVRSS